MKRGNLRVATTVALAGLAAASMAAASGVSAAKPDNPASHRYKDVQLLAINDFHGNLQPPSGSSGAVTRLNPDGTTTVLTVGGVEYLATHLEQAREGHERSLTVAAGDLIGASPLLSGAFHDEPTIEAMNALGLDLTAVGNHEFDEGSTELLRMQDGGCRANPDGSPAADSCPGGPDSFAGADFPFLSANVVREDTGQTLFPPYVVKSMKSGVKIGFIGMTLEGTPDIVTAAGVQGLTFLDEVETANRYTAELQKQGVEAIVVVLHQGGIPASPAFNYDCNANGGLGLSGDIVPIAQQITPAVDLIISGHTHSAYACDILDPAGNRRMVTSASSFGRLFTEIEFQFDPATRDIVRSSVTSTNSPVTRDVPAAPAETEIITRYNTFLGPIANTVIGHIGGTILGRGCSPAVCATGETPAGDLIADAQLEGVRTDPLNPLGADFAIMNPGGIRADFVCTPSNSPCAQTYAQAFAVQPFTNVMNVVSMKGSDVLTMFGQQWVGQTAVKILQISANVSEVVEATGAENVNRLVSVAIDGVPVDPDATYRVAMNEFLGGGGDGFTAIRNGTKVFVGKSDLDVLIAYLGTHSSETGPYPVPTGGRVVIDS